jgi:hypothetical protein
MMHVSWSTSRFRPETHHRHLSSPILAYSPPTSDLVLDVCEFVGVLILFAHVALVSRHVSHQSSE